MNKQTILILGAGLMQQPAILSAKKLGLYTAAADADTFAVSISDADMFLQIDIKDKEKIFEAAASLKKTHNLAAVFTAGTDFSSSVSYSTEKLGLPGHSYEAAVNASIKSKMRICFQEYNIPSPEFFCFTEETFSQENLYASLNKLGFPCVVKPVDNMGARGCRMIRNQEEALLAFKDSMKNSRSKTVILEKYMNGPEFSIDALIYNGTMTITGFADRHIYYPPYFIETGHTLPSSINEEQKLELISAFAMGVKALNLTCGAVKADIKYTERGPEIGEIAARLSGGYMSGWTFPYASNINLTEQAILIALGKRPNILEKKRMPLKFLPFKNSLNEKQPFELYSLECPLVSAERAWISIPGKIKSVIGIEKTKKNPYIKNVFERPISEGSIVDFPRNNVQKCGNIISCACKKEIAVNAAETAVSEIFIRLEACNAETDFFLSGKSQPCEEGFPPAAFSAFYKINDLELEGIIPENAPVLKNVPKDLINLLNNSEKDWNYMTALKTAQKFDSEYKEHPAIEQKIFWKALLKGGFQAAVYVCDSISKKAEFKN